MRLTTTRSRPCGLAAACDAEGPPPLTLRCISGDEISLSATGTCRSCSRVSAPVGHAPGGTAAYYNELAELAGQAQSNVHTMGATLWAPPHYGRCQATQLQGHPAHVQVTQSAGIATPRSPRARARAHIGRLTQWKKSQYAAPVMPVSSDAMRAVMQMGPTRSSKKPTCLFSRNDVRERYVNKP